MSRLTPRLRWRQAVAAAVFTAAQRPLKATLLILVDLMTPTGELHSWREEMVVTTGLPARTLDRHLQRAVQDGWLMRVVPGGHGRRSLYRATIPGESCAPSVAHNSGSCAPPTRTQVQEVVRHPVVNSKKKSTRVSEYVAVDDHRGTRPTPDGARGAVPHHEPKSGIDEEVPPTGPVVTDRSSAPTALPQAGDQRAYFEARGRALRERVLGLAAS